MRDLAVLFLHLLATVARLAGPGGARSVVAESVLVKQQVLILNRSRRRSPPDLEQKLSNSRTSSMLIGRMRRWKDGRQSRNGRMLQRPTATDGKSIAADSIRRRSPLEI